MMINDSFYQDFEKTYAHLQHARVRELYFDSEAVRQWVKDKWRLKAVKCQTRVLPFNYDLGATDFFIFSDKIFLFVFGDDLFVTIVESHDIAKSFQGLFEAAWRTGQEV